MNPRARTDPTRSASVTRHTAGKAACRLREGEPPCWFTLVRIFINFFLSSVVAQQYNVERTHKRLLNSSYRVRKQM